jgi:hypothetical protein
VFKLKTIAKQSGVLLGDIVSQAIEKELQKMPGVSSCIIIFEPKLI